jgi:hypothetical protein
MIKQKNPNAFEPKFKSNKDRNRFLAPETGPLSTEKTLGIFLEVSRGCNCKHSNCKKKYCECFQYGLECSSKCKCVNCQNGNLKKPGDENPGQGDSHNQYTPEETEIKELLIEKIRLIKNTKFPKN